MHLLSRTGHRTFAGSCIEALCRTVAENRRPAVIQMDADLSHPPEALPRMAGRSKFSSGLLLEGVLFPFRMKGYARSAR